MNTSTGELFRMNPEMQKLNDEYILKHFKDREDAAKHLAKLNEDEAEEADAILGDKESVILPEDHPLRVRVTERVRTEELRALHAINFKAKRKQARNSRKGNRK
jgi:hypothetical protein